MSKITVGLVDDNKLFQLIVKQMLITHDKVENVFQFYDGRELVDFLKNATANEHNNIPDLILLDLMMPNLDGWGVLDIYDHLKKGINKEITIIIVTSSISQYDKNRARDYEVVKDYVLKPLKDDVLYELIDQFNEKSFKN